MGRVVIISTCDECPHFDDEYWGYNETCMKLNRVISEENDNGERLIPDDCPLDKEEEK